MIKHERKNLTLKNIFQGQRQNKTKTFSDIRRMKEFITNTTALQDMLKKDLQAEHNDSGKKPDLYQGMKSIINYNYMCIRFFFIMYNSLKDIACLNKSKNPCIMGFITYIKIKCMSMLA